jgi:activating signal cointegrator 1
MKAITLWQPWASLVRPAVKTIETRSWGTPYRGPLLIHASKRCDAAVTGALFHMQMILPDFGLPELDEPLPLGAIVAVTTLADCRLMEDAPDKRNEMFGNFGFGRYGWALADIRPLLKPIPWRGSQGLWIVPAELERQVRAALEAAPVGASA